MCSYLGLKKITASFVSALLLASSPSPLCQKINNIRRIIINFTESKEIKEPYRDYSFLLGSPKEGLSWFLASHNSQRLTTILIRLGGGGGGVVIYHPHHCLFSYSLALQSNNYFHVLMKKLLLKSLTLKRRRRGASIYSYRVGPSLSEWELFESS